MPTKNRDLDRMLRFDPLDTAERMTGKSSAKDDETVAVGIVLMQKNAAAREKALFERGDTTFRVVHWFEI